MRMTLRRIWKMEQTRIFLVATAIAVVLLLLRQQSGWLRNVSDFLFVIGMVHILVGSHRYVRNVGLFKTFSYMGYKIRWKRSGKAAGELHPMSLADYTQNVIMDESRQKPVLWVLCAGVGWCLASFLLALIVMY